MTAADAHLSDAWATSDRLFGLIAPEAWRTRALPLRHPPIFYLGHLPAFAWNHVGRGVLGLDPFDEALDELFERGIDPDDTEAADAASPDAWPDLRAILAYRDGVRDRLREVGEEVAEKADSDELARGDRVWHLVREHEQMHHETLLYLLQELPPRLLRPPAGWPRLQVGPDVRPPRRIPVRRGVVRLGTALDDVPFAWDNEIGPTDIEVEAFLLDDLPVTVGRFRTFVEAGGYEVEELWDEADRAWLAEREHRAPHGWRRADEGWEVRSLFAWHPLDEVAGWPVQVTHAEARAYARWAGGRLPTEAELQRAAYGEDGRPWPWGDQAPTLYRANLGFRTGGPRPVGRSSDGRGPFGHHELLGNVWAWTDTVFGPLPGFEAWIRTYPGYSADFFDDAHHVVFGASWATADGLARPSFRNWYRARYPYPYAGFRVAFDA